MCKMEVFLDDSGKAIPIVRVDPENLEFSILDGFIGVAMNGSNKALLKDCSKTLNKADISNLAERVSMIFGTQFGYGIIS